MSSNFRYQSFLAVSWNLEGKVSVVDDVLSSHQQEIYPTTSLDENCIEFEFQTDRNYYVDLRQKFLALKLKLVRGRGYETYKSKEVKKEHKEEVKVDEKETVDEEVPFLFVTHVNNILHSIFSNVEVYINTQQNYKFNGLYAHKSYISSNVKGAISEYKRILHCEGTTMMNFLKKLWTRLCLNLFSQWEWKCLADLMASCCMVNWGLTFSPLLNCYIQMKKIRLRLIRAWPYFNMISDNPNVGHGIVDCSPYTRIALKDVYHKKRMDMLAYTPVEFNYFETLAKIFIISARQNQFIQENIF